MLDSFQFGGPVTVPASVSFKVRGDTDRGFAGLGPERNGVFLP